ncbi:hypothetical protein [Nocardiopsis lambiniae]|uniref:Uncharacterized protein n=1 Tax=Nocardiopsis lambiniae TaxID=3075539 RepID=A0ABU2MD04_9ACTN|nr:hypothetical protein [Nocardiopsis sp. DSM 44743]MDT0330572.1 hypothetical protein [Nocardiopsis sp. DSM 44743]
MDVLRERLMEVVLNPGHVDLPMLAAEALARGLDSPSLREVAWLGRTDPTLVLFDRALDELGLAWPTGDEAHLYAARRICARLLDGDPDASAAVGAAEDVYHHLCGAAAEGARTHDHLLFLHVFLEWDAAMARGVPPTPEEERSVVARVRELAGRLAREPLDASTPGHAEGAGERL